MKIFTIILNIIIFIFLTILTQIGGVIYLLSLLTYQFINKRTKYKYSRRIWKSLAFLVPYCIATFLIVPILAKPFGRVPLPLVKTNHLQPLNIFTCFLNRHYVVPEMKQPIMEVAEKMNKKFPGTVVNYLDASFPFIDNFPLLPHLSHHNGKKLDLAFCYIDNKTKAPTNKAPSFIGYGICEEPMPGEINTANLCVRGGHWQYNILKKLTPQGSKYHFTFDSTRTKELINLLAACSSIEKIFIEPHLKSRLKLSSGKIRFHGCQAVRHDDHIHIQL